MDHAITYAEYCEALAAVALYLDPDPIKLLATKLDAFLMMIAPDATL